MFLLRDKCSFFERYLMKFLGINMLQFSNPASFKRFMGHISPDSFTPKIVSNNFKLNVNIKQFYTALHEMWH